MARRTVVSKNWEEIRFFKTNIQRLIVIISYSFRIHLVLIVPLERNPDTAEMRKTTLISFNENEEWALQNVEIYSEGAFLHNKLEVKTNYCC